MPMNIPDFDIDSLLAAYREGASPVAVVTDIYRRIRAAGDNPVWISLTPEALARAEHLAMRSTTESSGRMDAMLAQWGVTRNVALSVNQLAAVPAILSSTQLVVCLPASLAALLPTRDLALQPLPFAQASVQIVAAWSRCRTNQPALKWILGRLTDICARFAEPVLMPGPKSKARRAFAQMV